MDKKNSLKTIYLEWLDPHSVDPWTDVSDIDLEPFLIQTFGILLKESENSLAVALNYNVKQKDCSCVMIIPKSAIRCRYEGRVEMRRKRNAKR